MTGSAGAATLNVPITALSLPENPRAGVRIGWAASVIGMPTPSQYQFAYITHPRADGLGLCVQALYAVRLMTSHISHNGTLQRVTDNGNVRG